MKQVYLVFQEWSYSEEDHESSVLRVYRLKDEADLFCSYLIDTEEDAFIHYYV